MVLLFYRKLFTNTYLQVNLKYGVSFDNSKVTATAKSNLSNLIYFTSEQENEKSLATKRHTIQR